MSDSGSAWNAIMQYSMLRVFANDGTIDAAELAMLERLAIADGVVDTHERAVLARVFARAEGGALDDAVREGIARLRTAYGID